jgi:purine-nucleoside phosphorylase
MAHPYETIADFLLANTKFRPEIGIICGSGLSGLSKSLQQSETFEYSKIPGFPNATVAGHMGELVFGNIGGIQCVCMRGRFHYYEGNSMEQVILPVRVMRLMGVKMLIVTNAAGGLNPDFNVGDIMIIQDHFGLPAIAGNQPLRGENNDELGPRFPAMSDAYDPVLQEIVLEAADALNLNSRVRPNGTYCFVSGPCYETKVECRFLRSIGGDSVGMSTVPEVIAAKHCGMKILGLSLITNKVVVDTTRETVHASHAEVLAAVNASGLHVEAIVKKIITKDVIGKFLAALPAVNYTRKAVTHKATSAECTKTSSTCNTGCSATSSECDDKKKCCMTSKCGTEGGCCFVTLVGLAALAIGLFVVMKNRH